MRDRRLVIDQCAANEELRGGDSVHLDVVDGLPLHLQPMQNVALQHQHAHRLLIVARLAVFELHQVRTEFRDPVRVHLRHGASEELRRVHDLACDDPQRLLRLVLPRLGWVLLVASLVEVRTGEERHLAVAACLVEIALLLHRDVAELAGQDAAMDGVVVGGFRFVRQRFAFIANRVAQLLPHIAPFAHPSEREVVGFAKLAQCIGAAFATAFGRGLPDAQQREEVRVGASKGLVRGSSAFAAFLGSLARIGNAQAGGDDEHLGQRLLLLRLDQHAAQRGVERQAREFATERRHHLRLVQRTEFMQQLIAAADGGVRGWIDEGEALDLAELERHHAQDDFRQVRALNLGHRELVARVEVFLREQANAHAVLNTTRAARALVATALRHRFHRQTLGPRARIVAADARKAGVHDVANARDGDGGLRHVRRDHDPTFAPWREDALLLGSGHTTEQAEHFV